VASVQVVARIREALRVELPLHRLFQAPTIAQLAALVEADPGFSSANLEEGDTDKVESALERTCSLLDIQIKGLDEEGILDTVAALEDWEVEELLQRTLRQVKGSSPSGIAEDEQVSRLTNARRRRLLTKLLVNHFGPVRNCPLSYAQERLWFLDQLQPGNVAYNLPLFVPLAEDVELTLLERALNVVVARHEALRTTFTMLGGSPVQRISPALHIGVEEVDLRAAADAQQRLQTIFNEEAGRPFDLARGPLLRAIWLRAPGYSALLLNMHHIVSDGWSLGVLKNELHTAYEALKQGLVPPLKELPIQYADFAMWQREWLQGERLEEEVKYAREQLAGAPPLLELPYDYPRPAVESYRGAVQTFFIPEQVVAPLRELARAQGATLFMVLLALFKVLLARYSGRRDVVVGTPVANRNRAELEDLIGFFVNMLVLRTEVDERLGVRELIERVRAVTLAGYEHQELPFEKLVEGLGARRSLSRGSVFQVAFVLQNTPRAEAWDSEGTAEVGEEVSYQEGTAKFDLTLYVEERGGGLVGSCEYRSELLGREMVGRMMRRYVQLLQAAGADADMLVWQLPLDAEPEPERQVRTDSGAGGPDALGHEVAALLGLSGWSRLAVLDDGDEAIRLLGETAAAAAGAVVRTGEEARAMVTALTRTAEPAAEPTHLLLTPKALAQLRPSDISPETVMVVVGLPWFAASLVGWEGRKFIGLWVSADGPLCCATVEMEGVEAVISEPLPGCWIEVLDERLRRQPADLWGMIYVGGEAVLHEQPTEERPGQAWVADPFEAGKRLFRTGMVGRRRGDGKIEVVGAEARMVRVDGMRVDPARLESLLAQHRGVAEVCVRVLRDEDEPYLVACVVPLAQEKKAKAGAHRQTGRVNEAGLLRYVGERLTAGLIPRRLLVADRLPDPARPPEHAPDARPAEPSTPAEAVIARIWGEVLGSPQRDVRANFFDRGGNSVASVQVVARIREALRVELPLHRLFQAPTIAQLAALVESERAESLEGRDVKDAVNIDSDEGADVDSFDADRIRRAPPGPRRSRAPLSFAQERLWFLDQFDPSSALYNMSVTIRLEADADPKIVRRVLREISRRHETLRTSFPSLGRLPQQVIEAAEPIPVPVTVLSDTDRLDQDAEVSRIVANEAALPFDLSRGPVLRARLIRAGNRYSCLSLVIHHIVFDGWSFGILLREFWTLYRSFKEGQDSPLEELPVQYADFARWQRRRLSGEHFKPHMEYWRQQLAGAPEVLALPFDRPRPGVETHKGATQWFSIPRPEAAALRALGRTHETTLFCVLLAAFKTLMMRLSNQEDVVIGSPIANRTRVEVEKLIGFFANTLALRTDLSGNPTFAELLKRVHRTCVAASEHQEVPFEKIVEELQPTRSLNHNPLFQVMLVLQNMPEGGEELREYVEAWQQEQRPEDDSGASVIDGTSKFDLTLTLVETEAGIAGNLEYSTDLFDHSTITRMIRQLRRVLAAVTSDPHRRVWQLPLMSPGEETELTRALGGPEAAGPRDETVRDMFEITARQTPSAPALIFGERVFSYGELNAAANRLARRLRQLGVTPGGRVAISMPRAPETLVAVLAALKAGAAYVPIDPSYPEARRSFMLTESRASLLVCHPRSSLVAPEGMRVLDLIPGGEIAPGESEENLELPIGADSPAYVIFTSGSTGRPKGVLMRHGALTNLIRWQAGSSRQLPGARTLQFTSLSFDVSFQELFLTWSTGGTLVTIDEETRSDPEALLRSLSEHGVERLFMPYVALQQLAETALGSGLPVPPLREVITAGEQLRITPAIAGLFERLEACVLRNQYGPTETHVATEFVLDGYPHSWPSLPPIGKPITNASVRILDRHLNPLPAGVAGEIYLAGECLALGYLEDPGHTADRFLPDRWGAAPGSRMYRTGDLGRVCADGHVEFLGRADHQVKVRGYRIEPAEIELTLMQIPEVEEAAVVALGDSGSDRRLAAFISGRLPADVDADFVREFLARWLPEYMIPSLVVAVERMPLTPSGKIDRQALMRSTPVPNRARVSFEPPSTPLERMLTEHWAELLGIEHIGVNDTFFSLGGHSLLATSVTSRIRSAIGLQLPVRSLFEAPTIRQLARLIAQHLADRVNGAQGEELLNRLSHYSGGQPQTSSPLTA
jgi:amino acid adenylation domain-containing protein